MYKIPANTLFIGKNVVFVPECHSTNTLAIELAQKVSLMEGSILLTNNQTKGRGQRGNTWKSEEGKDLTFSILLKPAFLVPSNQFSLTIAISLGIYDFLSTLTDQVKIKWPNDILINGKKVCGILLENSLQGNNFQQCIVGIGLNVNQEDVLPTATSLINSLGRSFNPLQEVFPELCRTIEKRYLQLKSGMESELRNDYLKSLYAYNIKHTFKVGERNVEGIIKGIDDFGKLIVDLGEELKSFDLKEITFIY